MAALGGGGCDDVVVVLGAAIVEVPAPARVVVAEDWASGMAASLRAGFAALSDVDTAVIHLVDVPDVTADVVRRVVTASASTGLARATYAGSPGHPVVVARRWWGSLLNTLQGDAGAREFLSGRDDLTLVECGDLASGVDVDEP